MVQHQLFLSRAQSVIINQLILIDEHLDYKKFENRQHKEQAFSKINQYRKVIKLNFKVQHYDFQKTIFSTEHSFFTTVLFLTGCDRALVKRIDLQRPIYPSKTRSYEEKKLKLFQLQTVLRPMIIYLANKKRGFYLLYRRWDSF